MFAEFKDSILVMREAKQVMLMDFFQKYLQNAIKTWCPLQTSSTFIKHSKYTFFLPPNLVIYTMTPKN